ncbi:DNA-3-methyladenine glycosylase family protein [Leptolyngbya sp. NIES-2104]|uniref:DNA-3-methyladenine glycosylase family protein n=1 Tax=Leptolyngbya sp. NIES-2104 TaxID=1552121 RepID=UPI0006ECABED|nr:DNA-3-methyladenine glycosylase [Leptolyngbya sp. NIES-2104]GAP96773.1 DNA-3-methyladenine glycosylase II [Leptolyngbya sp. NIES-2104]
MSNLDYAVAIQTLKTADPKLGAIIDQVGVCTLDQSQHPGNVLDSLARSIIYQQLSTKSATAIYHRFLKLYENGMSAESILNTPDEMLREVGLSRQKIVYVNDLAQNVLIGLPTLEELELLDDETIIQTLTKIKGIGRWTVQMLLIFRLHRWDVLPVDDLGIRSGIRRVYGLEEMPDRKTVLEIGKAWEPYSTIASWYLWRSLELPEVK